MKTRIHRPDFDVGQFDGFVLGGDVGGTNTNIGVAGVKDGKATLLYSAHFESRRLFSLVPAIREALDYGRDMYAIDVCKGVVGVAGPVTDPGRAKPTNLPWTVDAGEIKREFGFSELRIENDFMILGRGIESLKEGDLFSAKGGDPAFGDGRAVIGAGTGLGKAILVYDGERYRPIPSEGGHADFPIQDQFDLDLADFIRGGRKAPASYEDLLSGRGIEGIYDFLKGRGGGTYLTAEIEEAEDKAAAISKQKTTDPLCRETFAVYARCFGRCAKNFVMEALATGGLYIAGGIAAKNREVFVMPEFSNEFLNAEKQRQILEKTPVSVITNYDVSIIGACNAAIDLSHVQPNDLF
ncbi:glucokinase [Candidatus Methanocrinis natronophilus]|uniref:Glucokinase n=1 Tax=Candidatus Methanocrinis natronophilus TaxID=3033396 RepID=A0ABT5X6W6_9EURY|nr:glucokinase [Candidatus Methanocrinis natronophilus]MDF0590446.1 glucokinase [Candidatus Methanocrinis natronophilus]